MNDATLLIIEGKHPKHPLFAAALRKKGFAAEVVSSGNQALESLANGLAPDIVVVNAATLRTSGKRICQSLHEKNPNLPVLLILDPDREVENVSAAVVLFLPFTVQKLVNRIRHLLPSDNKNCIRAGPLRLDMEKHIVYCRDKPTRLTPRLARLLQALLERPGEVIERKALFSRVWETNYTDDTRTLDVHISWLRQAIEEDAAHPQFIKTIRGAGYRLDV